MERDTDQDWITSAGRTLPRRPVRSAVPVQDLDEFFATGEGDVRHVLAALTDVFGPFEPKSALDFGCEFGRLLIPLARQCGAAYGVDVSEPMLELAQQHCRKAGVSFELGRTISDRPSIRSCEHDHRHAAHPPVRGYRIVRQLWECVARPAASSMQITFYKDLRHTGELARDLKAFSYDGETVCNFTDATEAPGSMSMYDYNLSHVFAQMSLNGGCHGFFIYVRKT